MMKQLMRGGLMSLLCLTIVIGAMAQETYNSSGNKVGLNKRKPQQPKGFDPQKLVIGGGLGLGFGDVTSVAVSPVVGYRFTENFMAGIGLGYQYYRVKDYFEVSNNTSGQQPYYEYFPLKSHFFYPSVWGRYVVYKNFFVQAEAEYDMQSFTVYETDNDPNSSTAGMPISKKIKYNSPALLLGAGLRQPISDRSSLVIMAMYDVLQNEYSPYLNRIDFRIGFNAGF